MVDVETKFWWGAIVLGIIFVVLSSPALYSITNSTLGRLLNLPLAVNGFPTVWGFVIHSLLFVLVIRFVVFPAMVDSFA
jgi:hypothetical protein